MIIQKLKVYKSHLGEFEINFTSGTNILTGVNGTGKSTIMKMLNRESIEGASYEISYKLLEEITLPSNATGLNKQLAGPYGAPSNIEWDGKQWKTSNSYSWFNEVGNILISSINFIYSYSSRSIWYTKTENKGFFKLPHFTSKEHIFLDTNKGLMSNYEYIFNAALTGFVNEFFLINAAADYKFKEKLVNSKNDEFTSYLSNKITTSLTECVQSIKSIELDTLPLNEHLDTSESAFEHAKFKDLHGNLVDLEMLSDGQKRSILTSLIFEGESNLILLDEPTNFLSNGMSNILASKIKNSSKQIILITHREEFVKKLYTQLPNIIRLTLSNDILKPLYLPLDKIKQEQKGTFSFSMHAESIIRTLFSNKVLILEGVDDVRAIRSHKEIFEKINNSNWSIWNARGGGNMKHIVIFCEKYNIDYLAILDSDVVEINEKFKGNDKVMLLEKSNLEDYFSEKTIEKLENKKISKDKWKKEVKKIYDDDELIYSDAFYNEISNFLFNKDLEFESEFSGF
ncbi:ATP-dependent nuclease [Mycoplasma marinum]|uniref:AAA+ ATPase domain-containing protein n=1 Tax=Mycoplasma marinum TaxID=1937190 RepID=A0A4R0XN24_9MOLU|nr:TOPRIM nucleotidyl transferase/hydrolase domain-containing protein [Mycoplasma marinum]TCG10345.1 hypothetical protein C4B24_04770 [Mycoplasma marinum]